MVDAPPPPTSGVRRPARRSAGSARRGRGAAAASPSGSSRWRATPLSFGSGLGGSAAADGTAPPPPRPPDDGRAVSPPPKAPRSPEEVPLGLPIRPRRKAPVVSQTDVAQPTASQAALATTATPGQVGSSEASLQNTTTTLARVLYDFEPSDAVRRDFNGAAVLALRAGQIVELERAEDGEEWWRGAVQGTTYVGAFPSSFVEALIESPKGSAITGSTLPGSSSQTHAAAILPDPDRAAPGSAVSPTGLPVDANEISTGHRDAGGTSADEHEGASSSGGETEISDADAPLKAADTTGVIRQEPTTPQRDAPPEYDDMFDEEMDDNETRDSDEAEDAALESSVSSPPTPPNRTHGRIVHADSPMSALNAKLVELSKRDPKLGALVTELETGGSSRAPVPLDGSHTDLRAATPKAKLKSAINQVSVVHQMERHRQSIQGEKEAALMRLQQAEAVLRGSANTPAEATEDVAEELGSGHAKVPGRKQLRSAAEAALTAVKEAAQSVREDCEAARVERARLDEQQAELAQLHKRVSQSVEKTNTGLSEQQAQELALSIRSDYLAELQTSQSDVEQRLLQRIAELETERRQHMQQSAAEVAAHKEEVMRADAQLQEMAQKLSTVETQVRQRRNVVAPPAANATATPGFPSEPLASLQSHVNALSAQLEATQRKAVQSEERHARVIQVLGGILAIVCMYILLFTGDSAPSLPPTQPYIVPQETVAAAPEADQSVAAQYTGISASPEAQATHTELVGPDPLAANEFGMSDGSPAQRDVPNPAFADGEDGAATHIETANSNAGAVTEDRQHEGVPVDAAQMRAMYGDEHMQRLAEDARWKQDLLAKQHAKLALHNSMSSSHLRQQLQRRGLPARGGRETLLASLKAAIVGEHERLIEDREKERRAEEHRIRVEKARAKQMEVAAAKSRAAASQETVVEPAVSAASRAKADLEAKVAELEAAKGLAAEQSIPTSTSPLTMHDPPTKDTDKEHLQVPGTPGHQTESTSQIESRDDEHATTADKAIPEAGLARMDEKAVMSEQENAPASVEQATASATADGNTAVAETTPEQEVQDISGDSVAKPEQGVPALAQPINSAAATETRQAEDAAVADPAASAEEQGVAVEGEHTAAATETRQVEDAAVADPAATAEEQGVAVEGEHTAAEGTEKSTAYTSITEARVEQSANEADQGRSIVQESQIADDPGTEVDLQTPPAPSSMQMDKDDDELAAAAVAEAIAAPRVGANGEDRSTPAPREQSGAGRRDITTANHAKLRSDEKLSGDIDAQIEIRPSTENEHERSAAKQPTATSEQAEPAQNNQKRPVTREPDVQPVTKPLEPVPDLARTPIPQASPSQGEHVAESVDLPPPPTPQIESPAAPAPTPMPTPPAPATPAAAPTPASLPIASPADAVEAQRAQYAAGAEDRERNAKATFSLNVDFGGGKKERLHYRGGTDPHATASEFVRAHNLERDPQAHDDIVQVILDRITGTGADYDPAAATPSPPPVDAGSEAESDVLRQLFSEADKNSDGTLQRTELPLMLAELGMSVSVQEFDIIATTLLQADGTNSKSATGGGVQLKTLHDFVMGQL